MLNTQSADENDPENHSNKNKKKKDNQQPTSNNQPRSSQVRGNRAAASKGRQNVKRWAKVLKQ